MVLLPSCAVPGDVLSSCGVRIPVLVHYAMRLFSRCSLQAHLYLWFERLLSSSGVELPLEVWCSRLLLSRGKVWGLLSSCGVWVGSSLVAVCVLLSSCGWGVSLAVLWLPPFYLRCLVGYTPVAVCGLLSSYGEGPFSCNTPGV